MARPEIVARLMNSLRHGDQDAGRELVDLFYPELRRLAAARMKDERPANTWQPTALVHELYLELIKTKGLNPRDYGENERAAFLGLAGQMMRRLLIHHARPLYRRIHRVEIDAADALPAQGDALREIETLLAGLAAIDPKLRTIVELKVFEGLTGDEIAQRIGCSRRTVANHWTVARQWLQKEWTGLGQ